MKVYVAGRFTEKPVVQDAMRQLREHGHEITFDWTHHDATGLTGDNLAHYLRSAANADASGVIFCDVLLLLDHPDCRGAYTELGIAIGLQSRILVVGAIESSIPGMWQNIFMHLPEVEHVSSVSEAITIIDQMERYVSRLQSPTPEVC